MARISNNAEATYVVLAWDGQNPGVTNGYDDQTEAQHEVDVLAATHPHNQYFVCTQDSLRTKVAELTGIAVEALADPSQTINPALQQQAAPTPAPTPATQATPKAAS